MFTEIKDLYLRTRKPNEPLWTTWMSRPFGAAFAWMLRDTRVTPNHVSFLALFVSLVGAAVLLTWLSWPGLVVAILIYQLAYIIDCADGMLARLRGTASPVGHLLDFLGDEIKAKVLLGAVAVRLYLISHEPLYLVAGIAGVLLVSIAISLTTFTRRPEYTGPPPEPAPTPDAPERPPSLLRRAVSLVEWGARSLMNYPIYIVFLAVADAIEVYFWVYIGIYIIYVLRMSLQIFLKLGRLAPRTPPE